MMAAASPKNRLPSIDLARGLAVFFMIAVHTLEVFASSEVKHSIFGQVIEFLGGPPAAPVFMTLMGFSFIYSRSTGLKAKVIRGIKIFLSGYVLNVLRGVVPFKLATHWGSDVSRSLPLDTLNGYTILSIVDILQFAGIALVIMAVIQELKINKFVVLSAAILVTLVSPLLWGIKTHVVLVDHVLDLFWGDEPIGFGFISNKIAFPVFPWLAFPLMGMFLGETMKNSTNQDLTFRHFGIAGSLVLMAGGAVSYSNMDHHFNDYYHSRQGAMLFMSGFVVLWLFITKLMMDKLPMNRFFALLFTWSSGVTNIYFAQWIMIIWSIAFFGMNDSSYTTVVLLIVSFTALSHWVNEGMKYYAQRRLAQVG